MLTSSSRVHGGTYDRNLTGNHPIIDFSVNLNTYGPTARVRATALNADMSSYPDPQGEILAHAIADDIGECPTKIVVGSGACDLLWTLARVLRRQPGLHRTLIVEPTFCEWGAAAHQSDLEVTNWWPQKPIPAPFSAKSLHDFLTIQHNAGRFYHSVYICNPNSPTGHFTSLTIIAELARSFSSTLFILDEAFLSLSRHSSEISTQLPL